MAFIGFTITVFVTIKNKVVDYYDQCAIYTKKVIKNVMDTINSDNKEQQTIGQETATVTA